MKIKIIFLVIFALFTSQAFASKALDTDLNVNLKLDKSDDREEIHNFDFSKLFQKAEGYYRDAKAWEKIQCTPKSGFLCGKHSCKARSAEYSLVLDKKKKTVTRCEGKECESFAAEFEQTGVFVNIHAKGPIGVLIRVLGDYRYKEVTTVGLDAYIANGECLVVSE